MAELLFLHGAMDVPDTPVRRRIEAALGVGWVVTAPELEEPDAATWCDTIAAALDGLPDDAVVVGHSLGGTMFLKTMAERCPGRALARFVGLACPFFGAGGWDIPEFTLPPDFAGALHGLGHCRFLQDPRDEIVDISHLSIWARCLPHAILTETRGTGHGFETGDLSPVMAAILGAGGGS